MGDRYTRSAELLAKLAGSAPESKYIRAYHGSPYDFDRFDASKIGTGEGAQSFGHGLYFAQKEDVAKHYRDTVAPSVELPVPEELSRELKSAWDAYEALDAQHRQWYMASGGQYRAQEASPFMADRDKAIWAWNEVRKKIDAAVQNPGRVYEVEIAHPESALLNLDAMPNEQSPSVKQALGRMGFATGDNLPPRQRVSGFAAMRRMSDDLSPAGAAERLRGEGVPGLRYFDQDSRITGEGTRNYVMFPRTEDSIRILRKYGLLAPMAGAAMQDQ